MGIIFKIFLNTCMILNPKINFLFLILFLTVLILVKKFKIKNDFNFLLKFTIFVIIIDILNLISSIDKVKSTTEICSWVMIILLLIILKNLNIDKEKIINSIISGIDIMIFIMLLSKIKILEKIINVFLIVPTTNSMTLMLLIALNLTFLFPNNKYTMSKILIIYCIFILKSRLAIVLLGISLIFGINKLKVYQKLILSISIISILLIKYNKIIQLYHFLEINTIFDFKKNYSNFIRITIWKDSLKYLKENLLIFGFGGGNFDKAYIKYRTINFDAVNAHNLLLNNFVERGIIGGVWLIIFNCIIFVKLYLKKSKISKYLLLCFIDYFIYCQFEVGWEDSRIRILIYLLLFITLGSDKKI